MAKIENKEDLDKWLHDKPRKVAVVIAARAALRVLPLIGVGYDRARDQTRYRSDVFLPVFRAMATPWVAAKNPTHGVMLSAASAAADDDDAAFAAAAYAALADAAAADAAAAYAAFAAADAAAAVSSSSAAAYAAFAAAFAAAAAAAAAAAIWAEIEADADTIDNGMRPQRLAGRRLWNKGDWSQGSSPFQPAWDQLKTWLGNTKENWQVWIDWYEDRLHGRRSVRANEIFRTTLSEEAARATPKPAAGRNWVAVLQERETLWREGPAKVNTLIAEFLAEPKVKKRKTKKDETTSIAEQVRSALDSLPPPRPAALEPIVRDGRLTLSAMPAEHAHSDADLLEMIEALRQFAAEVAEAALNDPSLQYDKRAGTYLAELVKRLPTKIPTVTELHLLGTELETLQRLSANVQREWPDVLAAQFEALRLQFDRTLRQFPKWRAFLNAANDVHVTEEQAGAIVEQVPDIAKVLETPENAPHVDPVIPGTLHRLTEMLSERLSEIEELRQRAAKAVEFGAELLAVDILESVSNIAKVMVEATLKMAGPVVTGLKAVGKGAGEATGAFAEGFREELKPQAKKVGKEAAEYGARWVRRGLKALLFGGASAGLLKLSALFPSVLGWLNPQLAELLTKLIGPH